MAVTDFERDAINRRAKHLAMVRPFFAVEGGKGHSDLDLSNYDMRRVVLVVLDCIIVEMGTSERGANYDRILRAVRPSLRAANPSVTDSECDRVTSYALDALTNEREREAFRARYQVHRDDGTMEWITLRYKLVDVKQGASGDPIFFAEPPAINFYLQALEIDIEVAQAAKDGAHEYYMKRGRFGDAGQNAEESLKLTIAYRERLLRTTALLSRDIRSVDYSEDIVPTLQQSAEHIRMRMDVEREHVADVDARMDEAQGDALAQLARLKQTFQKTAAFYTSLATDVIGLDGVYLAEQARQRFRSNVNILGVGDPVRDLLIPALSAPARGVFDWVDANLQWVLGPAQPVVPSLVDLVALLLQDPQQRIGGEIGTDEEQQDVPPLVRFSPDDLEAAAQLFDSIEGDVRLSELVKRGRSKGVSAGALRNVVLRAFQSFEEGGAFASEPDGELRDAEFVGDDLIVRRRDNE